MPGRRLEVVPLSLDGVGVALSRSEIDYLFTNPGHLYRLVGQHRLSPMVALRSDRAGSPPTGNRFGAVILVRADSSDISSLADLKGRKLAAVAPEAFGGFQIAAATLVRNGIDPWRDLESIAFLGFPQERVIDALLRGTADAGTVRTGLLEAAIAAGRVREGELRVLNPLRVPGFGLALSTALVPEWILSATATVPEPERRQVAIALLRLESDHPAVQQAGYGGWTTVPSDAAVRQLLETFDSTALDTDRQPLGAFAVAGTGALSALLLVALLRHRRRRGAVTAAPTSTHTRGEPAEEVHLTPRETESLCLVGDGRTTKEIARDLGISPKTVEFHRGHLMRKYGAHNVAELIRKAGALLASDDRIAGNAGDPGVSPR